MTKQCSGQPTKFYASISLRTRPFLYFVAVLFCNAALYVDCVENLLDSRSNDFHTVSSSPVCGKYGSVSRHKSSPKLSSFLGAFAGIVTDLEPDSEGCASRREFADVNERLSVSVREKSVVLGMQAIAPAGLSPPISSFFRRFI